MVVAAIINERGQLRLGGLGLHEAMTLVTPQENIAATPAPTNTIKANQPKTTANAVPFLTLLMQVMPIAARTRVQMTKMSNDVRKLASAG